MARTNQLLLAAFRPHHPSRAPCRGSSPARPLVQGPPGVCEGCGNDGRSSAGATTQPAPLALGEAAPDAEALVVGQGELQALGPDLAAGADLLRLPGRAALLGEEGLRVG